MFNRYNINDTFNIYNTNPESVECQTFFEKQFTKQKIFTPRLMVIKKVEYFIDIGWVTLNFFDNPSVNLFDPYFGIWLIA